jgi:PAS domain S-box-containing protein
MENGRRSSGRVLAVGVAAEQLAPLALLGVDVSSDLAARDVALIVATPAQVAQIRAADEPLRSAPLLALVGDAASAPGAIAAGADYVLSATAPAELLVATYHAARRRAAGSSLLTPDALAAAHGKLADHVRASVIAHTDSEHRHRMMMDIAGDAILIADYDTARFVEANLAACAMFGYTVEEFQQLTGRALAGPDGGATVDRVSRALKEAGRVFEQRHPLRRKNGTYLWATVRLSVYEHMARKYSIAIIRDVTEQVEREQALERTNRQLEAAQQLVLHSSRLASLGQMAAGVAHEINNPLHFIIGGFDEIEPLVASASPHTRKAFADMREGAERIRSVTGSLLPFARVETGQPEHVDLNELVQWAYRMTANEIRHRAQVVLELSPLPQMIAHRTRLGQLVTNLLTNAAQAIEEGDSARNRIAVRTELAQGRVRLTIADTGHGIPDEIRPHIFDPFFTTKPREHGTGLGLSLCAEIVAAHHGTIGFESEVGKGTTFVVTFPAELGVSLPPPAAAAPATTTGARVLLIDDEPAVLRISERMLKGHIVKTACGGRAALELLAADHEFDAIVCDLMMPDVDGLMVYEHVRQNYPALLDRIAFCSGGAFTERVREFLAGITNEVLDKPLPGARLRDAVDRLRR